MGPAAAKPAVLHSWWCSEMIGRPSTGLRGSEHDYRGIWGAAVRRVVFSRAYRGRVGLRFWCLGALAGLVVAGLLVAAGAFAQPGARARGVGRPAAARAALSALGVRAHRGPEIVFGLSGPLRAGTVVSAGGPGRPSAGGRATASPGRVVARVRRSAWFFYEDLAPFEQYAHAGRVVLVEVGTGRVTVTRGLSWPPVLNGKLPAFLASPSGYDSARYRAFYRPYTGTAGLSSGDSARKAPRLARPARRLRTTLDSSAAATVAALLASQRACTVRVGDTLPGGYYDFAKVAQSRAALAYLFSQLGELAPGFASFIYSRRSGLSPTGFVAHEISARGCRDVLLYMAGAGYSGASAVNVGMGLRGQSVVHQDVTLAAVRGLVRSHPKVRFELVVDSPRASGFHALGAMKNVLLVVTPAASGGGSFTYLPEALVGGKLLANTSNPLHLLQLTDRIVFGITTVVFDPAEVAQMQSLSWAGRVSSALAYLIARALDRGAPVDYGTGAGVTPPPVVQTNGFPTGPPNPGSPPAAGSPVVTANPDTYTTTNGATLTVGAAAGVLANDSDSAQNPLTCDQLNGAGGSAPLHGLSAKGAAVTLNQDGSLSYDPSASAELQALARGHSVADTFTYRANDGQGGTATATVTIMVTGSVNHPPLASADAYSVSNDAKLSKDATAGVLTNDTDTDGDGLMVDRLNGSSSLSGTSTKGAAVSVSPDGSFTYDPNRASTLQGLGHGESTIDTFTYRVSDGHGRSDTATVTITVTGANRAPVAADVRVIGVSEDGSKTIGLSADDADGDNLAFSVGSGPSHGTLGPITPASCSGTPSHCTATILYTPAANYNGPDNLGLLVIWG
jgi:VCBS repeat-containing protein